MQTLKQIDPSTASEKAKQLLATFEQRNGRSPNMLQVMAQSPAILEAYLQFNKAFEQTRMSTKLRGLISIAMAQLMSCEYVLSVASALDVREGISPEELQAARSLESNDPKITQALRFAKRLLDLQGQVEPTDVASLQRAGYTDEEIVEIIGVIALNVFRNFFNLAVRTEVDFPLVRVGEPLLKAAAR
jgi:alkylhydroperoxidase family enzyme